MHEYVLKAIDATRVNMTQLRKYVTKGVNKGIFQRKTFPSGIFDRPNTEEGNTFFHYIASHEKESGLLSDILLTIFGDLKSVIEASGVSLKGGEQNKEMKFLLQYLLKENKAGKTAIELAYSRGDTVDLSGIISYYQTQIEALNKEIKHLVEESKPKLDEINGKLQKKLAILEDTEADSDSIQRDIDALIQERKSVTPKTGIKSATIRILESEKNAFLLQSFFGAKKHLEEIIKTTDYVGSESEKREDSLKSDKFKPVFDKLKFFYADHWEELLSLEASVSEGSSSSLNVLSRLHRMLRVLEVYDNEYWQLDRQKICEILDFGLVGSKIDPKFAEYKEKDFQTVIKRHVLDVVLYHYLLDGFKTLQLGDIFPGLATDQGNELINGRFEQPKDYNTEHEDYSTVGSKFAVYILKGAFQKGSASPNAPSKTPSDATKEADLGNKENVSDVNGTANVATRMPTSSQTKPKPDLTSEEFFKQGMKMIPEKGYNRTGYLEDVEDLFGTSSPENHIFFWLAIAASGWYQDFEDDSGNGFGHAVAKFANCNAIKHEILVRDYIMSQTQAKLLEKIEVRERGNMTPLEIAVDEDQQLWGKFLMIRGLQVAYKDPLEPMTFAIKSGNNRAEIFDILLQQSIKWVEEQPATKENRMTLEEFWWSILQEGASYSNTHVAQAFVDSQFGVIKCAKAIRHGDSPKYHLANILLNNISALLKKFVGVNGYAAEIFSKLPAGSKDVDAGTLEQLTRALVKIGIRFDEDPTFIQIQEAVGEFLAKNIVKASSLAEFGQILLDNNVLYLPTHEGKKAEGVMDEMIAKTHRVLYEIKSNIAAIVYANDTLAKMLAKCSKFDDDVGKTYIALLPDTSEYREKFTRELPELSEAFEVASDCTVLTNATAFTNLPAVQEYISGQFKNFFGEES